jgi:hypothetical protein
LNVERVCYLPGDNPDGTRRIREFDGPSLREGLLAGIPRGIIGWAKKQLKVQHVQQLDMFEQRLLYYVIAMRHADHELLPIERFDDLALTDFELVQHVVPFKDRDGDCGECSSSIDSPIHLDPIDAGELPPTTGPGGQETTGTEIS